MATVPLRFFSGRLWAAWVYPDHLHTILYDGSEVRGVPLSDEAYVNNASALGYAADSYHFAIEHDLLHSWLSERLDAAPSAALWGQAHDKDFWLKPPMACSIRDEERTVAIQAALNNNPWGLERMKELGLETPDLMVARNTFRCPSMTLQWAKMEKKRRQLLLPVGWEPPTQEM